MAQLGHNKFTGTNVRDDDAVNLLTGATLDAAGTTAATAVRLDRPGDCAFELITGTVAGTNPTLTVIITASDSASFDDDVVTVATITSTGAGEDNKTYLANAYVNKSYVKAGVTAGGTNPDYTGSTLKCVPKHTGRSTASSAGTII